MSKTLWGILILGIILVVIGCTKAGPKMLTTEEALKVYPKSQKVRVLVFQKQKMVDPATGTESIMLGLFDVIPCKDGFVTVAAKPETINFPYFQALTGNEIFGVWGVTAYVEPVLPKPAPVVIPPALSPPQGSPAGVK